MKATWKTLWIAGIIGIAALTAAGAQDCSSGYSTLDKSRAQSSGDYQVADFMDARTGAVGIHVFDSWGRRVELDFPRLQAEFVFADGSVEKVSLLGRGYDFDEGLRGASTFSKQVKAGAGGDVVKLRVWVPLPDRTSPLFEFDCRG